MYDGLDFESEEQETDIDIVIQKLLSYCIGETNEMYERYRFNKRDQELNESVDAYLTALRTLAKACNFGALEDSLIRNRIVIGVKDNQARKKLLQVSQLALKDCIDTCRSYETTSLQGVQRLLGMANYLQTFASQLSEVTTPLRELTKNDTEFLWNEQVHGPALEEVKKIISTTPVLKYFDPTRYLYYNAMPPNMVLARA